MFILQVFSVSVPLLDRPARLVQAFDAFEAAQRVARQLPTPAPVVVACRCHVAPKELAAHVQGKALGPAPGNAFQAKSVTFHFLAEEFDGVARVEVLAPQCSITVDYRVGADGVVAGLTTEGAGQLLLHLKGKTCIQEFTEYLARTVERAFVAGDLLPARVSNALRSDVSPVAMPPNQDVRPGVMPG